MKNVDKQILLDFAEEYFKIDKKFNSLKEEYYNIPNKNLFFLYKILKKIIKIVECEINYEDTDIYHIVFNVYFKKYNKLHASQININRYVFNYMYEEENIDNLSNSIFGLSYFDYDYDYENIKIEIYNILAEIKTDYDKKELDLILNSDKKEKRNRL